MNTAMTRRQWFRRTGTAAAGLALAPRVLHASAPAFAPNRVNGYIRLSSNENPYGPSESARKAMLQAFDEACRYPYAGAGEDLVNLIAEREGVTPEHVVIGCGSSEILAMTGMTYGMDSGEIVAADPTYLGLPGYAEKVGGYIHWVPVDESMVHDLDAMYTRITPAVKLVFVCNPNNPTGTALPSDRLRDFAVSASSKAVVFVDEAYFDLMDDPTANTMIDLVKQNYPVIISRTFSKIHGLAGQRIGYAITRPDIAERIQKYRMGTPNVIGLRGAIASLQDEAFQAHSRAMIKQGRANVYRLCNELGLTYTPSQVSFVFFQTGRPIQEFQAAMKDKGILVGRPFPPYMDWCRVSIGTMDDMKAFGTALREVMAG